MAINKEAAEVYESLGVRPAITASGATTMYGGSKLRPEIYDVMNKASSVMVNIDELNIEAGKAIANMITTTTRAPTINQTKFSVAP